MELFGSTSGHAPTVLAVDGNRTNLGVIGRRLGHFGYLTALCDNGPEALGLIAGRGFDVVLLDMALPGMSGLRVLEEIRGTLESVDLPVIMLTGRSDPAAAVQALAAGADDHVSKPFDFEVLAARIERLLSRGKRIADLKRANTALDARIATRAVELGEAKAELAETRADRRRLISSIQALNDEVERLAAAN
uniref:response regulator n=1 Tax=Sphingomonas sp. TaxID=28214 RepID=UPI0025CCA6F1|nr:response regulator [Sphingomonas sp.]